MMPCASATLDYSLSLGSRRIKGGIGKKKKVKFEKQETEVNKKDCYIQDFFY